MTNAEAIEFFEQQAKDEQEVLDEIETNPDAFWVDEEYSLEQYKAACQKDIDACNMAIEALKHS